MNLFSPSVEQELEMLAGEDRRFEDHRTVLEDIAENLAQELAPYDHSGQLVEHITIAALRAKAEQLLHQRQRMQLPKEIFDARQRFLNLASGLDERKYKNNNSRRRPRHQSTAESEASIFGDDLEIEEE